MAVIIKNLVRRPQAFNLTTQRVRKRMVRFEYDGKRGTRHTRRVFVDQPTTLSLLALEKSKPMADTVALEGEILNAEASKVVKIYRNIDNALLDDDQKKYLKKTKPVKRPTMTRSKTVTASNQPAATNKGDEDLSKSGG